MELHQASQLSDQAQREKTWLRRDVDKRNEVLQEDHAKDCKEVEELRRVCCEETDKARPFIIDELSMQQKGNPSTVNQLLAQIQDLQDKVNSLNHAREFYDPDTASSSGVSHVPSQPMSIQSPRGMISRDSCFAA